MDRKIIDIDVTKWRHVLDFYADVLGHVGAPNWHGKNINALVDSIVYGGINAVEPPYTIRFRGVNTLPNIIVEELRLAKQDIDEARLNRRNTTGVDADVEFEIA